MRVPYDQNQYAWHGLECDSKRMAQHEAEYVSHSYARQVTRTASVRNLSVGLRASMETAALTAVSPWSSLWAWSTPFGKRVVPLGRS